MPIYEFHCPKCDSNFEVLVLSSDEKVRCPECQCKGVDRLMSGFAHKSEGGRLVSESSGCSSCSSSSCAGCH
jgi:putative FmdB family regulatory protein